MRNMQAATAMGLAAAANAASLANICNSNTLRAALPSNGTILGIELLASSVTASPLYNVSASSGGMSTSASTSTLTYCNVTVAYTHTGKGDNVVLKYAFPEPSEYKSRFYVGGGGGYSLSSDATGGLSYGAVGGATDAGYDAFNYSYDEKFLYGNGSVNWDSTYMFSYQALGEITKIGKLISQNLYSGDNSSKVYTYFEGCSNGGREGMSQVQRQGDEYDGVIAGAPTFRFAQQQVHHVFPATVSQTLDYYPPPCELDAIVNATISACDPLDSRTDGVISRTDLCKLHFNLTDIIGTPYYCAATSSSSLGFGFSKRQAEGSQSSTTPAQNGTVSQEGIEVAQAIYDGLHNSKGERAYLSQQIGSDLSNADPTYNNETGSYELNIPSTSGIYVTKYIELLDIDNLSDLDSVTYDTLVDWMNIGMWKYFDSLQTTVVDLTNFREAGSKLLYYYSESDPSIPAGSSVHYWQSVREAMYDDLNDKGAREALQDWYQFYLVPSAGHCGSNNLQPSPYPQNNMNIMIDWVENGNKPARLNAMVSSGDNEGETQILCQWPTRPIWRGNSTEFNCEEDQESVNSWTYEFNAFKIPVW